MSLETQQTAVPAPDRLAVFLCPSFLYVPETDLGNIPACVERAANTIPSGNTPAVCLRFLASRPFIYLELQTGDSYV